ncbi:hypothetical protein AB9075_06905 [Burkholderia thailandensis]|uniref:hypothetical protein n=1 Tax=Burkholderia thailandensis TaxID=57975 RepID=UPI003B50E6C5
MNASSPLSKVHVMTKHSPYEDAEDNYDDPVDYYDDIIDDASEPEPDDEDD